ncbi:ATP-binding cassette domain-containing protein [Peptoniphilus stercorisuis]|uniref:ABC-2 type transport system ATP-binding protein n=1 Tax=Peptoniphilus stercorisuis TaxID=1436965 RepID=A0ABS4KCG3_9FIRM|nr:ABC transporter ATP-binding protein [Peptoniphilus stercorisuis]MBP2025479.1 ABC-2 type transport system ATP-binding protein [Peptoniphilus stercorisuis]
MSAIVINNLTKRMGKKIIFSNINLEVLEGEFFSLLALEGEGKTTLARILFNYLKPAMGSATIFDMNCSKDSKTIKESVGYVSEELLFQENIKASTLFKKTLALHNLQNTEELKYLLDYFGFNPKIRVPEMTENDKKIFSIINALIVKPRLIILDEPTRGLTVEQSIKLFEHLNKLKTEEGLTILLLTDSLIEAQNYCDRAAYLYNGEIKDIEYLNDKISNDKIVKIYSNIETIDAFTMIGSKIIKNTPEEKVLYFDGDLKELSRTIADLNIDNYSIEDSSLADKITAYYTKKEAE